MPSETFFCPRCSRQLTKSAQAYVLGEMMASEDSNGIFMGEMASTVTCPGCGAAIDAQKMMQGEYDRQGGGSSGVLVFVVLAGVWILIVAEFDQPWWVGLIGGLAGAGLVDWLLSAARKNKKKQAR